MDKLGEGGRVSREAFEGGEFHWFGVDAVGHVGHFSTAGFGPVPLPVLDRPDSAPQIAAAIAGPQTRSAEHPATNCGAETGLANAIYSLSVGREWREGRRCPARRRR